MSEFYLEFAFNMTDGWLDNEDRLATLIEEHGGTYDGGGTDGMRRNTYGVFPNKKAAEECGKAAWYLNLPYLSYTIDPIQEGTQEDV